MLLAFAIILLCSSVVNADAGLLDKSLKNAVFYVPWKEQGSVIWSFNQKEWGTWNILGVGVNKVNFSAPTGTDWEYVYLAQPQTSDSLEWMGGNHNNEVMKSLEFVIDGEVIKDGRHKVTDKLVINESTELVYPKTKRVVGTVVRHYEINVNEPNVIRFSQTTTWLDDMYVERAYMCMLPIWKKHGRHFEMDGITGSFTDNIKTGQNKGWGKVTETLLYGDNGWGMIVGIKNLDSVDNYQYAPKGAFIWDLAMDHVKIYYPRVYENGLTPVSAGTVWQSESYYIVVPVNK